MICEALTDANVSRFTYGDRDLVSQITYGLRLPLACDLPLFFRYHSCH
jgi:hypothetical protein